jgi:hypothetical protein
MRAYLVQSRFSLRPTVGNMKRLGFRSASVSTEKNVDLKTKPSQTTEPQLFYIVCYGLVFYYSS